MSGLHAAAQPLPIPIAAARKLSSGQVLHRIQQALRDSPSPYTQQSPTTTAEVAATGEGLVALLTAGEEDDVSLPYVAVLTACVTSSPCEDTIPPPPGLPVARQGTPLESFTVMESVFRDVKRRAQRQTDDDHASSGIVTKQPRKSPTPSPTHEAEDAVVLRALRERHRRLQKLMWKHMTAGHTVRGGSQSPKRAPSPPAASAVSIHVSPTERPQRDGSPLEKKRQPSSPFSMPRNMLVSACSTSLFGLDDEFSSTGHGSRAASPASMRSSLRMSRGSFRFSASMDATSSVAERLPDASEVAAAFAAAQRIFMRHPLRRAEGLITQKPKWNHDLDDVRVQLERDYSRKVFSVADELSRVTHHCVLVCMLARDVSPADTVLRDTFRSLTPHFLPPFGLDDEYVMGGRGGQLSEVELRGYGAEGLTRWVATSHRCMPTQTLTIGIASDATCNGIVEFPGTSRAGEALTASMVLASKTAALEHEALREKMLMGFMGLEWVGRQRLWMEGPREMQRIQLCFHETVNRSHVERRAFVELFRLLVHIKRSIQTAVSEHMAAAGITASMRKKSLNSMTESSTTGGGARTPPPQLGLQSSVVFQHSASLTQFANGLLMFACESLMEAHNRRQHLRDRFRDWTMFGEMSLSRGRLLSQLSTAQASSPRSPASPSRKMEGATFHRKEAVMQSMALRWAAQSQKDVFHAWLINAMRRKTNRHLKRVIAMEEREAAAATGGFRSDLLVSSAAYRQATVVAKSISRFLVNNCGEGLPNSVTITGHSTGGAVALLVALILHAEGDMRTHVRRVVTFGAPKVFREGAVGNVVLQRLQVLHIPVVIDADPAPHQPWTFSHSGTGAFVIASAPLTNDGAVKSRHHASVLSPTSWPDLPPRAAAAQSYWKLFHSLTSYAALLTGMPVDSSHGSDHHITKTKPVAVVGGAKGHSEKGPVLPSSSLSLLETVHFEAHVLNPNPVKGGSHGFSQTALRCLQNIATRYGVGNAARMPRDLILGLIGLMLPGFAKDVMVQRVPTGSGGRLDQTQFILWLWQETLIRTTFLADFLMLLKYEFNGKEYFPTDKHLVAPPPPPKFLAAPPLCHYDTENRLPFLTTVGRQAMERVFDHYSRPLHRGPFEFRLPAGTHVPLMTQNCVIQVLRTGRWPHLAEAEVAVPCVFQQVAQLHCELLATQGGEVAPVVGNASRRRSTVHDRLFVSNSETSSGYFVADATRHSAAFLALGLDSDTTIENSEVDASASTPAPLRPLMSFSGDLTRRGFVVFMQLFVQSYGVTSVEQWLVGLGFNRLWQPMSSQTANITFDIHWKFGPCPCLTFDAERRRIATDEERVFKAQCAKIAAEMAIRRRASRAGSPDTTQGPSLTTVPSSRILPENPCATPTPHSIRVSTSALAVNDDITCLMEYSAPIGDATEQQQQQPYLSSTLPMSQRPQSQMDLTMYSWRSDATVPERWSASGNGKRLQKDARRQLRTFRREEYLTRGTSFGSKPKRQPSPTERAATVASIRAPEVNGLSKLTSLYGPQNTLRLMNTAQRRILQLPPLRNHLLDPDLEETT